MPKKLNPLQKQYLNDCKFLQALSKTGFGKVPENLFDGLYKEQIKNYYESN